MSYADSSTESGASTFHYKLNKQNKVDIFYLNGNFWATAPET